MKNILNKYNFNQISKFIPNKIFSIKTSTRIPIKYFSEDEQNEFEDIKVKQISGVYKPIIKAKIKRNPKNEQFYGIPHIKQTPKNKEDLITKIGYLNNFSDVSEFYHENREMFSGSELGLFLERVHICYMKEYRLTMKKAKDQKFIIQKESEVKADLEEKLNIFLEEITKSINEKEKEFSLKEMVNVFFEIMYRFRKDIQKEFADEIFEKAKEIENLEDFKNIDLIKLSFILSRYNLVLNTLENAQIGLSNVTQKIIEGSEKNNMGLSTLSKEELLTLVTNLSFRGVYPDLEFFLKLEPHILKYMNEYSIGSLVHIFSAFIKNYLGTSFFLQTIGFSIASNLDTCDLRQMMTLLDISNKKFYNRPELSIKFPDLFINIFSLLQTQINNLNVKDINFVLRGMINSSYNDKKLLHLLSTIYLKFAEREDIRHLVHMMYYFAVCDLENVIFYKKTLEILSLNFICLQNYLNGNEGIEEFQGLFDKPLLKRLEGVYMKNIDSVKDKLRYFERIQYSEEEIHLTLDLLCKMAWTICFFLSKLKDLKPDDVKQFLNGVVQVFNNLVSNLKNCEESGVEIKISKPNIDKVLQSYLFMLIVSEKFSLKHNLNTEFLKLNTLTVIPIDEEVYDYEKFLQFKQGVTSYLNRNSREFKQINYQEDFSDIQQYKVHHLLGAEFVRKLDNSNEIIFINDPFDFFEISMNSTGFTRLRKNICSLLNLNYLEIDYNEFLVFYKDFEIESDNLPRLIEEFMEFKINTNNE